MDDPAQLPPDVAIAVVLGASTPGFAVPSLDELVLRTGLPALDVAFGLEVLMDRRAVELVPGTQRLVTRRIPYRVDGSVPLSLTSGVERSGTLRPGVRWRSLVRSVGPQRANLEISDRLRVRPGRTLIRVVRDRLIGERVVGRGESWLRDDAAGTGLVEALFEHGSLASVLAERHGGQLRRLGFDVALRVPPTDVGEAFGPAAGEHAWYLESMNSMDGVAPLELSRGWLRADHFRLIVAPDDIG